jgi:hypothetical protein
MKRIIIFMLVMSVSLAMAVGQHKRQRLSPTVSNWGDYSPLVVIAPHPGWPQSLPKYPRWWPGPCRVVATDLDGDKREELMILVQREESGFFILNEDGTIRMEYIIPFPLYESFSVADLDNDGKIEIVASTDSMDSPEDPIIYVWDLDTPYDPLNMPWPMYQHDVGHSGRYVERSHILPPSDITLQRQINRSLFRKEAYHTFTWAANPRNRNQYDIAEYRIYRRHAEEGDDQYRLLTALPADTFTYEDGPLDYTQKYVYVFTSMDVNGDEGLRSVPLSHEVPYGASR